MKRYTWSHPNRRLPCLVPGYDTTATPTYPIHLVAGVVYPAPPAGARIASALNARLVFALAPDFLHANSPIRAPSNASSSARSWSSLSTAWCPYVRSIMRILVPMRRATANVLTPALSAHVA